jgi:hypothetical protein
MHSRSAQSLLAIAVTAALALPAVAQARQGADDPIGHVRHNAGEVHHHHAHHARSGADDGPGHR